MYLVNSYFDINTIIAHGKNGMSSNVESEETAVKSCNEQDTRYPL